MTADSIQRWKHLKKIELHRHLDCSLKKESLREWMIADGLPVAENLDAFRRENLVLEPLADLAAVIRRFQVGLAVLSTPERLRRLTRETVEEAAREGTEILELRYSPTFVHERHPHLSFEEIHRAFLAGIADAASLPVRVGLILIVMRTRSLIEAQRVIDFALSHRDSVVAVDLADDEEVGRGREFAKEFQRARGAGLGVTIHAAEVPSVKASDRMREAIDLLGATRIGHGLQVVNDKEMLSELQRRRIHLEICITSNWLTRSIDSVKNHPLPRLLDAGVMCSLSTDDPGVFDLTLSGEYSVAVEQLGLSEADLARMTEFARCKSFLQTH